MEIIYKIGNLLDAQTDVIAHQVNCRGVMGSGVAKQIKERWPVVFETYKHALHPTKVAAALYPKLNRILGNCQLVDRTGNNSGEWVANLFAQHDYGRDNKRYTNYEALYTSLSSLKEQMDQEYLTSVSFPYKMSSDRGGADWNIVLAMIESVFKDTNITIEIWKLE